MNKKKQQNPVTIVIVFLIALFAVMIAWTLTYGRRGAAGNKTAAPVRQTTQQAPQNAGAQTTPQTSGAGGARPQDSGAQTTPPALGGGVGRSGGGARQDSGAQTTPQAASGAGRNGGSRTAQAVRVRPVGRDTIENSIVINGDVLAAREVSIYPVTGGKITDLRLRVGDTVRSGEIVAIIDPSRPGEIYSGSPVRSTITGTILQAPFSTGDTVTQQSAIFIVGDLSSLVVETHIPERFSASIQSGLTAAISFDSMPNESWTGVVSEISPILDPASRTLRIRLRFQKPDSRIRAGMFATISLVTASAVNVLVIPRSSVINTYGSWIVFIAQDGVALRRELTFGLESESEVQVLTGLTEGELVIVSGQNFLSNNESVRIVSDVTN
ncbi:hypothetical protein FACS1894190_03180 [Spirochaetia bacterium]|nr:hypothetical protein FACS1894190_03180 [Spirochaetia bacterium]